MFGKREGGEVVGVRVVGSTKEEGVGKKAFERALPDGLPAVWLNKGKTGAFFSSSVLI